MTQVSDVTADDRHSPLGLADGDVLRMYRTMLLTRALDERAGQLERMGLVSAVGHEAAQVGSAWAARPGDVVLPYYRDLGVVLALGVPAYEVLLGVFAAADDPSSGGRQMPSHWGSAGRGIISRSTRIATHLPHAMGIAKAIQLWGARDDVVLCYFGEGATAQGDFHEACTFAGLHRLPVVLVCENNGVPPKDVAEAMGAYGFPGVTVDGTDALDVYGAVRAAVRRARRREGPTLVECRTVRFAGDAALPDEIEAWRRTDPLARLRQYLIEQRALSNGTEAELEAEVAAEIEDAVARAGAAAAPAPGEALTRVFARPVDPAAQPADEPADEPASDRAVGPSASEVPVRTVVEVIRDVQRDLLAADPRVVILGEDVGARGGLFRATEGLYGEFGGQRVIDTPLAESAIVGIAIGMALAGMRPIAELPFADLTHAAFDQIVSEAAKLHYRSNGAFAVPLVIRAPWGGGVRGGLYHSQAVEAFYAHVAGLKVVAPSTPADVAGLLRAAADDPDPVLFLEHKKTYRLRGPVPDGDWTVPIGRAAIARPGSDVTVVTYGLHRHLAVDAAAAVAGDGIDTEVVDLRTISPLDRSTIVASAVKTGRVLVVHEDNVSFGVGAEVAAIVASEAFYDLDAPVRRLAMPDVPAMPYAASLEDAVTIGTDRIADAVRRLAAE